MAVFGNKDRDGRTLANFSAASVPGIEPGWAVEAVLDDRALVVRPRVAKQPEAVLPYEKISAYELRTAEKTSERRKSAFGRALAGGLLFGPVGAVAGGVDGSIPERKRSERTCLAVECDGQGPVVLEVVGATVGLRGFLDALGERAPWAAPDGDGEKRNR